ncbi:MAG: prepilin-type N-terminal cleavage/methylation domain-containing protein [Planctomycetes bacterium]|nr:prepilin-type N-terminal cleavage/methylation domain-containing protein [Planctomycetota bacterium]MBI3844454.1 prepilin-type N-terminal cleavage/methylation domain-containing protein [Planctomycetota bacterium]
MGSSERQRRAGLTLVEVLLTLAIVGMLMASLMGVFMGNVQTKERIEIARATFEIGPTILDLVEHDVQAIYFSDLDGESALSGKNHTVSGLDADKLELITSNDSLQYFEVGRTQRNSDFTRVSYALRANPEASGFLMLYRRETALPDPGKDTTGTGGYALVYDHVRAFNVTYYSSDPEDPVDGFADWDAASDGKLPSAVRLDMEITVAPTGGIGGETATPQDLKYSRLFLLPPGSDQDLSALEPLAKNLDSVETPGEQQNPQGGPGGPGQRGNRGGAGGGRGGRNGGPRAQPHQNNPGDSGLEDLFGGK